MTAQQQIRQMRTKVNNKISEAVRYLGIHGLHGKAIAALCGVSVWKVYHICYQSDIKLRDYRDGLGMAGTRIASKGKAIAEGRGVRHVG